MTSRETCRLCHHHCKLATGQVGFCRARQNQEGKIRSLSYGRITSAALDPIEKKPLCHFFPGSYILSVGSFGCNLVCPFCQNFSISQADATIHTQEATPEELLRLALELKEKPPGNIGVAFTYNEPLIGYEFVLDTAKLLREAGLKTVLVTNGLIEQEPLRELLPYIDALNIDLKAWNPDFYRSIGGDLHSVQTNIALATKFSHVEVTTLVIPGKNDSVGEMEAEAKWLANISSDLPLHISRYFPRYRSAIPATPAEKIYELVETAKKYLRHVYSGNC